MATRLPHLRLILHSKYAVAALPRLGIETIEIVTPAYDASGAFTGINHETIFYDPDVFVAPVRATLFIRREATPADPNPRFTFVECLSNIRNVNGCPTQLTPGHPDFIDYYGRPWAKNWEKDCDPQPR